MLRNADTTAFIDKLITITRDNLEQGAYFECHQCFSQVEVGLVEDSTLKVRLYECPSCSLVYKLQL